MRMERMTERKDMIDILIEKGTEGAEKSRIVRKAVFIEQGVPKNRKRHI